MAFAAPTSNRFRDDRRHPACATVPSVPCFPAGPLRPTIRCGRGDASGFGHCFPSFQRDTSVNNERARRGPPASSTATAAPIAISFHGMSCSAPLTTLGGRGRWRRLCFATLDRVRPMIGPTDSAGLQIGFLPLPASSLLAMPSSPLGLVRLKPVQPRRNGCGQRFSPVGQADIPREAKSPSFAVLRMRSGPRFAADAGPVLARLLSAAPRGPHG